MAGDEPFGEKGKDCKLLLLTLRQSDHRSGFKRAAFWCPRLRPVSIHVPQSALIEFQGPDVAGEVAKGPTEDEFSWVARPYARLGYITDRFLVGLEGGYQYADLQFDLGEDPDEWYIGAFIGIRLSR